MKDITKQRQDEETAAEPIDQIAVDESQGQGLPSPAAEEGNQPETSEQETNLDDEPESSLAGYYDEPAPVEEPPPSDEPSPEPSEHDPDSAAEDTVTTEAASSPPPTPPGAKDTVEEEEEDPDSDSELGARMTFLEHLDELRRRILYCIIGLAVGFAACWVFREEIYSFIRYPIDQVVDRLVMTKPTEAFTIYMRVAFVGSIFLTSPFILVQVWMFIAPGLYRREKRFALPFLLSSTTLFLLGATFAYYIVLPPALRFLILDFGAQFTPMITAMDYFNLVLMIIVGMGAVFQLPVLIAFLSMFGLVTPRFLWKNFRYAFLLITIAAAIVSPTTDPFNLLLWSGPMVVLYLIGIVVSWIFKRRREKREAADS
ncbi:MAG TPA: twin-arginine translocase subunit TatC [Acidobacteriota bacterium]|nr:twin-arginine translocase subunit TatC [Acidobacteriota bacterium]